MMPWADVILVSPAVLSLGNCFYLMMCSLDELSMIIVNLTSACRDVLQDYTVVIAQAPEIVIGSRGRHGIKKQPIRIIFRVNI